MNPPQLRRSRLCLVSRSIVLAVLALLTLPFVSAQKQPNAQDLLQQMTLQEKIAQLSIIFPKTATNGCRSACSTKS